MKPASFDYICAANLDEALSALREHGPDARVIAGGQSLMAMLNMRLAKPALLVDIMRIPGLGEATRENGSIVVPAAVRQSAILARDDLRDELPLLAAALLFLGISELPRQQREAARWVTHTLEVLGTAAKLETNLATMASEGRGVNPLGGA